MLVGALRKNRNLSVRIDRILIIRLSSIGDILLATPLIRSLARQFPKAKIDFVIKTQFHDLLQSNPHLNHLYEFDTSGGFPALVSLSKILQQNQYDLVVDIHNNLRSLLLRRIPGARIVKVRKYKWRRFLLVKFGWNFYSDIRPVPQRYLDTVADYDVTDAGHGLEFFPESSTQDTIDRRLKEHGWRPGDLLVAMAPGASKATKRWPIDRFMVVAEQLTSSHSAKILLLGDGNDAALTSKIKQRLGDQAIDLAGKLDLMQSACALNRATFAITNDSGLMHLATSLGKPVVAIFGSTVRELGFFPVGEQNIVIERLGLSCRPCTHIGRERCPKKHFKCMVEIESQQVFRAAQTLVENLCLEKNP